MKSGHQIKSAKIAGYYKSRSTSEARGRVTVVQQAVDQKYYRNTCSHSDPEIFRSEMGIRELKPHFHSQNRAKLI